MEKIININYKGTLIPIGEGAYQKFVQYQDELKQFLNKEADADEVFEDLQFRMYEILKSRLSAAHSFVGEADVEEVIAVIGRPHDLYEAAGDEKLNPAERVQETNYMEQSKLRRDRTGKFISGLCSGIANFLGMDPLALRLIVIMLFIITPLPTLVIYALGYIIPEEPLLPNTSRKLYRNPKDKILGGVCGGLATLFGKETWIFRIVFLLPILISIVYDGEFNWFSGAFGGSSTIAYIVLWIITPIASTQSDFMLMQGQGISLSNYNDPRWQNIRTKSNSAFNTFFRIVAFILVAMCLIVLVPTAFGILIGGVFIHDLAAVVLATALLKTVFWISLICFFALPIIAIAVWLIRRLMGVKKSPKLKMIFGSLIALGLVATIFLAGSLFREMRSYKTTDVSMSIKPTGDTLYVKALNENAQFGTDISITGWNNFVEDNGSTYDVNAVMFDSHNSNNDSVFSFNIIRSSFGSSSRDAINKASAIEAKPYFDGNNTLYVPKSITFAKNTPYRGQHVKFRLNIPEGKTLILDRSVELLNDIHFGFKNEGKVYEWDEETDELIESSTVIIHHDTPVIKTNSNDSLQELGRKMKQQKIDSLRNAIDSMNDQIEKMDDK